MEFKNFENNYDILMITEKKANHSKGGVATALWVDRGLKGVVG